MPIDVTMPQMGESVVEGTIERWLVAEGDRVEKDQTLCEVTTDKVDAEIPAPESGVVKKILVPEGETVEVGTEIATLEPGPAAKAAPGAGAQAAREQTPPRPEKEAAPAHAREAEPRERESGEREPREEPARVSPLARRMAKEHGVDLERVTPSEGRVTRADVASYLEGRGEAQPAEPAAAPSRRAEPGSVVEFLQGYRVPVYQKREGDRVIPFSAVRRRIAEHMVVSKIVSPHVGTVAEVDLSRVVRLRERAKRAFEEEHGFKLTYLPFVVQATVRALREYPRMNATVVGEEIVERSGIHVGVAVETDKGLLVPVVRDADRLSLSGIAQAIQDLAERARSRRITADEIQGGTFTVTNPGREGNLYGFAVINQPQVGILRTGEIRKRPVVVERDGEETIAIRPMMHIALSYDHRVIDGVTGNGFLHRVGEHLEAGEFEI